MRRSVARAATVVMGTLTACISITIGMSPGVASAARAATRSTEVARLEIGRLVQANYAELPFGNVACPRTVPRSRGASFACTVQLPGSFLVVQATQSDEKGTFALATPQAVLTKQKLEQLVSANASLPATVDCGAAPFVVRHPGEVVSCRAALADGTTRIVDLTVRDAAGNVTIVGTR
jgi:hypothetical protein